jgi:hypothetical protein
MDTKSIPKWWVALLVAVLLVVTFAAAAVRGEGAKGHVSVGYTVDVQTRSHTITGFFTALSAPGENSKAKTEQQGYGEAVQSASVPQLPEATVVEVRPITVYVDKDGDGKPDEVMETVAYYLQFPAGFDIKRYLESTYPSPSDPREAAEGAQGEYYLSIFVGEDLVGLVGQLEYPEGPEGGYLLSRDEERIDGVIVLTFTVALDIDMLQSDQ